MAKIFVDTSANFIPYDFDFLRPAGEILGRASSFRESGMDASPPRRSATMRRHGTTLRVYPAVLEEIRAAQRDRRPVSDPAALDAAADAALAWLDRQRHEYWLNTALASIRSPR